MKAIKIRTAPPAGQAAKRTLGGDTKCKPCKSQALVTFSSLQCTIVAHIPRKKMNETESTTFGLFKDFCLHLEYHLCATFRNSHQKAIQFLWCDGVLELTPSDPQLTRKHVNDTRRIETRAWIGQHKGGQDIYQMTIRFGRYSVRRYAKGKSLTRCLPSENTMDWIDIDVDKKTIEVRLR